MSFDMVGAERQQLVIRVKNTADLVAKQAGATGAIAAALAPDTVEGMVYKKLMEQIQAALKTNGVEADVVIVAQDAAKAAESKQSWLLPIGTLVFGAAAGYFAAREF